MKQVTSFFPPIVLASATAHGHAPRPVRRPPSRTLPQLGRTGVDTRNTRVGLPTTAAQVTSSKLHAPPKAKGTRTSSPRRLLHKVHLPFRGQWPRASPRDTKPGRGSKRTVNKQCRAQQCTSSTVRVRTALTTRDSHSTVLLSSSPLWS